MTLSPFHFMDIKATLPKHVAAHAHFLEMSLISFQGNGYAVFVGDDPFYNFVCVCVGACVFVCVCVGT